MRVDVNYNGEELTVIGDHTPELLNESATFRIDEILIRDTKTSVYDDYDAPGHLEEIELIVINLLQ